MPLRTCRLHAVSSIRIAPVSRSSAPSGCPCRICSSCPFVAVYAWWANGIAGLIPSSLAYLAGCAGIYRLARHWLRPSAAVVALVFFAINPNLLYLQTTAMTEPLFLCEMIWLAVWMVEWRQSLDNNPRRAARLLYCIALVLVAAVFTRYDGWILALLGWTAIGIMQMRQQHSSLPRLLVRERSRRCRANHLVYL